jgi:excisionase family DNA binding protein
MKLLRPKDVAEILNCSVREVYNLKDHGKIPCCKIGGMVRFRPEDVESLIQSSIVETRTEPRKVPSVRLKNIRV